MRNIIYFQTIIRNYKCRHFVKCMKQLMNVRPFPPITPINRIFGHCEIWIHESSASLDVSEWSDELLASRLLPNLIFKLNKSVKSYAFSVIDAFGNMPRSFIWGNNFWFSSAELCSDVSDPFYISLSSSIPRATSGHLMNATSPYKMHLQMIYFNYTSSLQLDLKQQYQVI